MPKKTTLQAATSVVVQVVIPPVTALQFEALERRVERFKQAYLDAGQALKEIRETRAYELAGYKTFSEYVSKKLGFELRQAERQIEAAEVALLTGATTGEQPSRESVARELAPALRPALKGEAEADSVIAQVQEKLVAAGASIGEATAAQMRTAVQAVAPSTHIRKRKGALASEADGAALGDNDMLPGHNGPAAPGATKSGLPGNLTDTCPHCGEQPDNYLRDPEGWKCGQCGQPVKVGVVAAALTMCPKCGEAVLKDAVRCPHCGAGF